jgi:Lrp/AsnC family leucine-responsive transcriptional regulator
LKANLDEVDVEILRLLQENGRMTNADVSRQIGLSPPSILQRIRKLEKSGVIERYQAILGRRELGYSLMVIAHVSLKLHQDKPLDGFVEAVCQVPEVVECLNVSGEFDFMLRILVSDMDAYESLIRERLSAIPEVGRIQSSFVLGIGKENRGVPV